jgi:hypothetical protein
MGLKPVAILLPLLLAGCATADRAQLADGATTWVALSKSYTEANPVLAGLSGPEIIAVKLAVTQAAKLTPEPWCSALLYHLTWQGYGAALWNAGVMLGSGPAVRPDELSGDRG